MLTAVLALALGAAASPEGAATQQIEWPSDLAVAPLMARRNEEALAVLEESHRADPNDPAVLINLGIAYAQMGEDGRAHDAFTQALSKRAAFDLATSGGRVTDSRQLARKAIRMLENGEFRTLAQPAGQLTLRD